MTSPPWLGRVPGPPGGSRLPAMGGGLDGGGRSPSRRDERGVQPRLARQKGFSAGDSRDRRGASVIPVGLAAGSAASPGAAGPCGAAGGALDPPSLSGCWRLRLPCRESCVVTEAVLLRVFGWGGAAAGQGLGWTRCVVVWRCCGGGGSGLHPHPCGPSGAGRGFWNRLEGPQGCAGGSVARWGQGLSPQPPRLPRTHLCAVTGSGGWWLRSHPRILGFVLVLATILPRAPERVTWVWVMLSPTMWGHPGSPRVGMVEHSWEGRWL